MTMKTMVVATQKGGVGKTFVVCQLGFHVAQQQGPTLLLDLDHQCNASQSLIRGGRAEVAGFSTLDLLEGRWTALPRAPLVLVPGAADLSGLERQPANHNAYVGALQRFLAQVDSQFVACLIDTNPSPDVRYASALAVADYLLAPVQLTQEALDGIATLLHHGRYGYHKLRQVLNPGLELIGILPNLVEATPFQRANLRQLVLQHPGLLIPVVRDSGSGYAYISNRTAVAEAQAAGVPLWQLRQAIQADQTGAVGAGTMPLRSAAREAWREIRPSFDTIIACMGLGAAPCMNFGY